MEKIYGTNELVGLQLFLSGTPTFSSGTPTFCQMGVLNSCFQNPNESSAAIGPRCEKTCLRSFEKNKDADQPGHLRSLISDFVIHL